METIINYAIGILGLILAYYFYKKGERKKEPVYSIKSVNVISDYASKYEDLTVSYKGEKVENFTVSKLLFYNHGADTIDKADITTLNQLKIIGLDCEILNARVLQASNSSIDFKLRLDRANSWVIIDFEYLNTNQGAVFELVHTGLSSEHLEIQGDIRNVQMISQIDPKKLLSVPMQELDKRATRYISIIAGIWLSIALISPDTLAYENYDSFARSVVIGVNGLGLIATLFAGALALSTITNPFRKKFVIPKGLEKFFE
jgi:hypothetical protein